MSSQLKSLCRFERINKMDSYLFLIIYLFYFILFGKQLLVGEMLPEKNQTLNSNQTRGSLLTISDTKLDSDLQ